MTFGGDPEFVLMDGDIPVSAIGILPNKYNPIKENGHSFYYDNVMAEIGVLPSNTATESVTNFVTAVSKLRTLVYPLVPVTLSSLMFNSNQLSNPIAREIGCSPEFCAYEMRAIPPPTNEFLSSTLRTAGGHIHIGYNLSHSQKIGVIRMMDLFVGVPSVFLDIDKATIVRKKLYGRAGRFRTPPHGVEYRTLSNFWVTSPKLISLFYNLSEFVVDFTCNGGYDNFWKSTEATLEMINDPNFNPTTLHSCSYDTNLLRTAIDTNSSKMATPFLEKVLELLPVSLSRAVVDTIE